MLRSYLPGLLLFILSVAVCFFVYEDHGVGWDEFTQREIGEVNYRFVTADDTTLLSYEAKDYGPGFELPLYYLEKKLGFSDTRDVLLMRHLVTHLFFLCGCLALYVLAWRLFRSRLLACMGFLLLVFHPRIYAHSFFNSKDIPFLAMFVIALAIVQVAFDKRKIYWYAIAGATVGYASALRMPGVILAGVIGFFIVTDIAKDLYERKNAWRNVMRLTVFSGSFFLLLYASFPFLWQAPVENFIAVFTSSTHYPWEKNVLFMGDEILSTKLPWYYLPVWIGISTPVVWLAGGVISVFVLFINIVCEPGRYFFGNRERNFPVYAASFFLPLLAVMLLGSVVYDDWRHVYFVYPPFVLILLYGISRISSEKVRKVTSGILLLQLVPVGYFMIKVHPQQQVYFNELAGKKPEQLRMKYELDYWGCSTREALEYILANDKRGKIKVNSIVVLTVNNMAILPKEMRERIEFTTPEEADYFLTNFRFHKEDYPYNNLFFERRVGNSTIMRVYRLK